MVDVTFPNGRKGWLNGIRGTVYGYKKWSDTHVYSTPGISTYSTAPIYHPTLGQTGVRETVTQGAPRVTSYTTDQCEYWLRSKSGKNQKFDFRYPVADGHEVVILWGSKKGAGEGPYLFFWNVTTNQGWNLNQANGRRSKTKFEHGYLARANMQALWWWFAISALCMIVIGSGLAISFNAAAHAAIPGLVKFVPIWHFQRYFDYGQTQTFAASTQLGAFAFILVPFINIAFVLKVLNRKAKKIRQNMTNDFFAAAETIK